jgi:hypothetical protein
LIEFENPHQWDISIVSFDMQFTVKHVFLSFLLWFGVIAHFAILLFSKWFLLLFRERLLPGILRGIDRTCHWNVVRLGLLPTGGLGIKLISGCNWSIDEFFCWWVLHTIGLAHVLNWGLFDWLSMYLFVCN